MYWCKQFAFLIVVSLYVLLAIGVRQIFGAEEKLLVFGRVQDNPVRAIRDRQEFVDYVAKKLAPFGFTGGKVLVVEKVGQLAQAVRDGNITKLNITVLSW
jgi:Fe2+ transport system protein FeoA